MSTDGNWILQETTFDPDALHHQETIFTIGNGYLATRGGFEEGYPGESESTLIHGVFDDVPLVFTELANAPDWTDLEIRIGGECFSLAEGEILAYQRVLDLQSAVLTRQVRWRSPHGRTVEITFERFASLADPHLLFLRASITLLEDSCEMEVKACLAGSQDTLGIRHWDHLSQQTGTRTAWLHLRTRATRIELALAERLLVRGAEKLEQTGWDVTNHPTLTARWNAKGGETVTVEKVIFLYTSRDTPDPLLTAADYLASLSEDCWDEMLGRQKSAWEKEWEASDVVIEGDDEAQLAIRFNIYQLLIAAPRHDDRVSIGAKTLSGFGYRGHAFWDTEIFMLPFFTFTTPGTARNLLDYRYRNLPGAREKAESNGYEGAQFPWESAGAGKEVTPTWLPHFSDPTKLVRIWTGDIEIHISADIAYAAFQYWQTTGDDEWMANKGAELILDTAKFWASRAEWNAETGCYEYNDVVGPDEYHDHVDNNFYTNRMAQWNLQTAFEILDWLEVYNPKIAAELIQRLDLTPERREHWRDVISKIYLDGSASGLIEQFEGYFQLKDVDLADFEPREESMQAIFGIEEANEYQAIKQPDVLMLMFLLEKQYSGQALQTNYAYYTPRTDHTFGSSLGPSIQAIMACRVGLPEEAYEHFIRAARADLVDVRGNTSDGVHAASAGGTWLAATFGFAGLRPDYKSWTLEPRLPKSWKRLAFKFYFHGKLQTVDIRPEG